MKIAVFGAGYVGLVTGTCLAELGNEVVIVDVNQERINQLNRGIVPIYEPGLDELIIRNSKEKRLIFTLDGIKAIKNSEIIFIAVGTPPNEDGSTNLTFVLQVAKEIGKNMNSYKLIVNKSTVPVGTADKVKKTISELTDVEFDIVSNPEFLKEGSAVQDFMVPDRIVVGIESEKAEEIMADLYSSIARTHKPLVFTDIKSSELIKYASNAMLACRISFMNQLAPLCEKIGADIKEVAKGIGLDDRIGPRFLQAGVGYGGSCFPKDVQSLSATLKEYRLENDLIESIEKVNSRQKDSIIKRLKMLIGEDLKDKTFAIWGLSFKPKTDDMREAPSLVLIKQLLYEGAKVRAFDPEAMENTKQYFPDIYYSEDLYDSVKGADCIVLLTEWDEFRNPSWDKIKESLSSLHIFDGRNIYSSKKMIENEFKYLGVGKK
ncbi:UDP-glucose 6-dehydrogenase [Candidatus Woesearchaeota archaeon]|nr:MAG: UDP-glucose 6-dehydrogenase [Candidatus Woesearchaeota archaeon]